jgi:cytochrome c2
VISRDDIDEAMPQKVSNMPANVTKQLSDVERNDLIAFLLDQRPALDDVFYMAEQHRFFNPYDRVKNGPPLANVMHKVGEQWLKAWLKNPQKHSPQTFMPNLELNEDEIVAVTAYLRAIADTEFPSYTWSAEFTNPLDKLTNEEFDRLEPSIAHGKQLWSESRCGICHRVGESGGFVGHAPELTNVAHKLRRNWLSFWLADPRYYFASSQMPHFSFSPEERKDLTAYLLRSDEFGATEVTAPPDEPLSTPPPPIELIHQGRLIMDRSRCHVCHDVPGFEDLPFQRTNWPEPRNDFEQLIRDRRCLTCHAINGKGGTFAPELATMGSRLKKEWIEKFLVAPDVIRPLIQQMPKMKLSPADARAASDYAKSDLIDPSIDLNLLSDFKPDSENIAEGKSLYEAKGCRACHQIGFKGGAVGPALTNVADRLEAGFIFARLKSPQRFNPTVVEPNYGLSNAEALELTKFMLSLSQQNSSSVFGSEKEGDR